MSTQINITVDSGGLADRAKQQQQAARQAQLEKERTLNLSAEALDKRVAAQAAKGQSLDGQPLYTAGFKQPQVERRPAANRTGGASYIFYYPTEPQFLNSEAELPSLYTVGPILKNKKAIAGAEQSLQFLKVFAFDTQQPFYLPTGGPYQEAAVGCQNFDSTGELQNTGITWRNFNAISLAPTLSCPFTFEIDARVILSNAQYYEIGAAFAAENQNILVSPDYINIQLSYQGSMNPASPDTITVNAKLPPSISIINKIYYLPHGTIFPNRSSSSNTWQRTAITLSPDGYTIFVDGTSILTDTFATTAASVQYTQFRASNYYGVFGGATNGPPLVCAFKLSPKVLYTGSYIPRSLLL